MAFLAFLHVAFLPFRQMEGFLRKLAQYIPKLKVADYSTICKRMKEVDIDLPEHYIGNDDVVLALDASGMKVTNRGEWMRHKWKVRKGWIKVHIAVDTQSKKLLALHITDEQTGDGTLLKTLVDKAERNVGNKKIKRALGDGSYDSRENFDYLNDKRIEAGIKIRKNASPKARGSPARARYIREKMNIGYEGWKSKYKYGQRWAAETYFSGVKRTFGETTKAKTTKGMFQGSKNEIHILQHVNQPVKNLLSSSKLNKKGSLSQLFNKAYCYIIFITVNLFYIGRKMEEYRLVKQRKTVMELCFEIKGQTAVITGASSGLGVTFAEALAETGVNLVIVARRYEKLTQVAEDLSERYGVKVVPVQTDVSQGEQVIKMVQTAVDEFGSIEILVNNAGIATLGPSVEMNVEEWKKVLDVNLTGVFLCARTVAREMIKKKYGKIVNVSSIYGAVGDIFSTAPYYASKGAVINLTRALAIEWAPYKINVNAIAPGFFPSEMTEQIFKNKEMLDYIISRTPLRRTGNLVDLKAAIIYLASPASDFVTGQTIFVDGGWTSL